MIESGTLNDRIRFLSPVTIRNKYGEQLTSWELSYSCWAKVTYNKGVRAITAGEVWLPNTVSVLVRYTNKRHDRQRIVWNDSTYRIESFNASKKDGSATIIATKIDEGTEKGG